MRTYNEQNRYFYYVYIMRVASLLMLQNRDNKKPSDTGQKAVSSSVSENASLNSESEPENDGKGANTSSSKSDNATNSTNSATDSSSAGGSENQNNDSDNSTQSEAPPLTTDEYELPFIPN